MVQQLTAAQTAIIPDTPRTERLVNEDRTLVPIWSLYFDQITQALQNFITPEGLAIPLLDGASIAQLTAPATQGNIIYNTTSTNFDAGRDITYTDLSSIEQTYYAWDQFCIIKFFSGNPDTLLAGMLGDLCLDLVGKVLYVCTSFGVPSSLGTPVAEWTLV